MAIRYLGAAFLALLLAAPAAPASYETPERGTGQAPLVAVKGKGNGAILRPGATAKLKVKVTDRAGRPLAGVDVLFAAPEAGAGGTFQGGDPPDAITRTVATNANGIAGAKLTANDTAGVYLVSAVVGQATDQSLPATLTFALTNGTAAPPPLTAARARSAVHEQLLAESVLDETLQLHGPVLLAAGTLVEAGGPASDLYPTEPFTTTRASWFFWIDENPNALYLHPTRFVVVDASDTSPDLAAEARVTREGWWPQLTAPGAAAPVSLLPAAFRATPLPDDEAARLPRTTPRPARMPAMDACAVVACGPPERQLQNDAAYMVEFFEETLGVPHVFTMGNIGDIPNQPVTAADLNMLLARASQQMPPCKKLYIYITSHANGGGFQVVKQPDQVEEYKYSDLAKELQRLFGGKDVEICIILTGCSTAGAIGEIQNHGLRGTIVAGSQLGKFSYMESFTAEDRFPGHAFGTNLRAAWTDVNGDGHATLEEAFDNRAPSEFVSIGMPIIFAINPNVPVLPLPSVVIPDKTKTVKVTISRPPLAPINTQDVLRLDIPNPNVAVFANGNPSRAIVFMPGQRSVEVEFRGLVEGVTTYTGAFTIEAIEFKGESTIRVGNGYGAIPNPIRLKVGESRTVTLARGGVFEQVPHPTPILIRSGNPLVAGPETATLTFPPFAREAQFTVNGVSPGVGLFVVFDLVHGVTLPVVVEVTAEKCALFEGMVPCETGDRDDECGHHKFIQLGEFDLEIEQMEDGTVRLSGSNPQMCAAVGEIDPDTCAVTTAECQATVAGFPGVRNQFRNVVVSETTNKLTGARTITVTGQYAMGIGGELPGGCPIVYEFSGSTTQSRPR